jgi:hypothetical protein
MTNKAPIDQTFQVHGHHLLLGKEGFGRQLVTAVPTQDLHQF